MSFWTDSTIEPKRNFRFQIIADGWAQSNDPVWYWAKSIDKPSFNVSNNEYQLINHKFKYPGIVTWNNIQINLVDFADGGSPNAGESLKQELIKMGYTRPDESPMRGVAKYDSKQNDPAVKDLVIQHLAADGKTIVDMWTIRGAFIISVSYSRLDYSNDELSEVTLEIAYDYADYGSTDNEERLDRLRAANPQPQPGTVTDL